MFKRDGYRPRGPSSLMILPVISQMNCFGNCSGSYNADMIVYITHRLYHILADFKWVFHFFQNEPSSWCWGTTGVFKWPHITSSLPFIHHVTMYGVQRLLGQCRWSFGRGRLLKQMFSRAPDLLCGFLTSVILWLWTCVVFWPELLSRHNQIHLFWSHVLLESAKKQNKKQNPSCFYISIACTAGSSGSASIFSILNLFVLFYL